MAERVEHEELLEPGKRDTDTDDVLVCYFAEIRRHPLLTADEERDLSERVMTGDKAASKVLVQSNLRLVIMIAKEFKGMTFADRIQDGNMGLIRAAQDFDWRKGRFSTYATNWIRQAITRGLQNKARTIRIPTHVGDQISLMYRSKDALRATLHREPTYDELAEMMGVTADRVQHLATIMLRESELDAPYQDDPDATELALVAAVPDEAADDPVSMLDGMQMTQFIQQSLSQLTPREREVLSRRYGFDDRELETLEQIGLTLKVTRERVRQIEEEALRKVRRFYWQARGAH